MGQKVDPRRMTRLEPIIWEVDDIREIARVANEIFIDSDDFRYRHIEGDCDMGEALSLKGFCNAYKMRVYGPNAWGLVGRQLSWIANEIGHEPEKVSSKGTGWLMVNSYSLRTYRIWLCLYDACIGEGRVVFKNAAVAPKSKLDVQVGVWKFSKKPRYGVVISAPLEKLEGAGLADSYYTVSVDGDDLKIIRDDGRNMSSRWVKSARNHSLRRISFSSQSVRAPQHSVGMRQFEAIMNETGLVVVGAASVLSDVSIRKAA